MDLMYLLALVCFYGPTPLAAILAGLQAVQCKAPWHAFVVALVGTIVLAVVFGVAVDFLPLWGMSIGGLRMWQIHLMVSPVAALPLAAYCAYLVEKRSRPPTDPSR